MGIGDKLKDYIDQGISASKGFVNKAGAKAQDLGEKGVLKIELMQFQSQEQKLFTKLGEEVFESFTVREQKTLSRESPAIRDLIKELEDLKDAIRRREEEMQKN